MSIYLKKFETQSAYEAAESSLILPNVSFTVDNNTVHYNPSTPPTPVETILVAKYNVTDTSSSTQIIGEYADSPFSAIEIDGVEQAEITTAYTFSTIGEHTVKYTLKDPTSIGNYAFQGCSSLTSIDIPSSVTIIGESAFYNCSSITSCTIGNGVTTIGSDAFSDCSSLTSIDIPDSVTSIGYYAFGYCSSLTSVTIGSGVTSIGEGAFSDCSSLTSIDIPSGVTSIGDTAFGSCSSLTSIDIPNSVTSIGNTAFQGCSSLGYIDVFPSDPPELGSDVFYDTNDCPIYVPDVETYASADGWSNYEDRLRQI